MQEIKTTAALQHPHILPLFDSGAADGFLFYVMPFIDGETLRAKLDRETQLGVDNAVPRARSARRAALCPRTGHRAPRREAGEHPAHGGHAMVADFGIALAVSAAAGGHMTETGLSLGTPHYMSPEQATAEKDISARVAPGRLGAADHHEDHHHAGRPGHGAPQVGVAERGGGGGESLEKLPADRFEGAKAFAEALGSPAYTNAALSGTGTSARGRAASAWHFNRLATTAPQVVSGPHPWIRRGWWALPRPPADMPGKDSQSPPMDAASP